MEIYLDEPLRQKLNHGACETISRIHMADFHVENTLGIQVQVDTRGYADITFDKDKLTLEDFLGNAIGENANTCIPNQSGRTCDCVEEFAVIFQQQYDNLTDDRQHIFMRGCRYTAPPLTSTCSVVCQSYKGNNIRKFNRAKVRNGFHNPIGAFRRKADYIYEKRNMEKLFRIKKQKGHIFRF